MRATINVNGKPRDVAIDALATLVDVLRDELGLTGTKAVCGTGFCGACTVLRDGRRINACLALAAGCAGSEITTIEHIASRGQLHPVQQAFLEHDALQCGYCTPGQIMSAIGYFSELREQRASPGGLAEQMSGNLCRCGTYTNILAAVAAAAERQP